MYILFENISNKFKSSTIRLEAYCPLKALLFYFKISLTVKSHGQYGLTRIVHLDQFNQSLSKMV